MSEGVILASASTARAAMLRAAGVPFRTDPAHVDEDAIKHTMLSVDAAPSEIAMALAEQKAHDVSPRHQGALILGADQVLVHRGELLSKTLDMTAARAQLARLRGDSHQLLSATAIVRDGVTLWRHSTAVTMTMRPFSDQFLDGYLARIGDLALGSVGCYHLEGPGAQLFARVEGDYFTVLGLPLLAVLDALRVQGVLGE